MNSVKSRISFIITGFASLYLIISFIHYTLNYKIQWMEYVSYSLKMSLAAFMGVAFIWISQYFMNNKKVSKDYFSPTNIYQIPKAPFIKEGLHPLEAELLCLIERHACWPVTAIQNTESTLKETAHTLWKHAQSDPKATHLHRIVTLALHTSSLQCFKEVRKHPKPWHIWQKDKIKYSPISTAKNSLSVQIIKCLPSFSELTTKEQDIVVQSLTFYKRRHPTNLHTTAIHILDFIYTAETKKGA